MICVDQVINTKLVVYLYIFMCSVFIDDSRLVLLNIVGSFLRAGMMLALKERMRK